MSFADDLLEQAYHLANRERKNPKQASLRRAVSTPKKAGARATLLAVYSLPSHRNEPHDSDCDTVNRTCDGSRARPPARRPAPGPSGHSTKAAVRERRSGAVLRQSALPYAPQHYHRIRGPRTRAWRVFGTVPCDRT